MKTGKLDEYAVKARVFPAFLALFPLGICVGQFMGFGSVIITACSTFGGTALLSFVLAQWSRDAGKLKEESLYQRWGGKPTTAYLRHSNQAVNAAIKMRRRQRLERLVPDLILPSVRAEVENPVEADERYDAATKVLIQRTRDKQRYSVLFHELIDYGFRRNTWGLKATASAILVILMAVDTLLVGFGYHVAYNLTAMAINAVCLLLWVLTVTPEWVHRAANAYAERLFDALDEKVELDEPKPRIIDSP